MPLTRERELFVAVMEAAEEERAHLLRELCPDDAELRIRVLELLRLSEQTRNLLDDDRPVQSRLQQDLAALASVVGVRSDTEEQNTGRVVSTGHHAQASEYVLREKVGEGGFGCVYVAEQLKPVKRRVALKLLKSSLGGGDLEARFEAEGQALAMMEHPNIARIFDVGTSQDGQRFFAMELVRGVHITRFCKEYRPDVREPLKMFIDVCLAVQHAHQKGIIHRDLKPSNVLVMLHDDRPVVKVIDFGVAKALHDPLTDKTIYTQFAQMIGTPMYMSPEQADMNPLDIDIRSDVYSLGVLLYELLTGLTPFDQHRMQTALFDELRRMIREEDPPRPSARLKTLPMAPASSSGPLERDLVFAQQLRGDLDWIVMKALEKDRRRRYDTAGELARDVQRYLDQEPVIARPPSTWYRLSRFVKRNRVAVVTTSLVLGTLLLGTIVSTWQAIRATGLQIEADHLRGEAVDFANRLKESNVLLESARANADQLRWQSSLQEYTKATELQPDHFLTWAGRGSLYLRVGAFQEAGDDYARAIDLGAPANNPAWWGVPQLCLHTGHTVEYKVICQHLDAQLSESTDPMQLSMAIRSLCLEPLDPQWARVLAERADLLLPENLGPSQRQPGQFGEPRRPIPLRLNGSPPFGGPPPRNGTSGPSGPGGAGGPDEFGRAPWEPFLYTVGLARFRSEEYSHAQAILSDVIERGQFGPASKIAWPVLAMARMEQGDTQGAHSAFQKSQEVIDEWLESYGGSGASIPWFDMLEMAHLHDEAEIRIMGQPLPANQRWKTLEEAAQKRLQSNDR